MGFHVVAPLGYGVAYRSRPATVSLHKPAHKSIKNMLLWVWLGGERYLLTPLGSLPASWGYNGVPSHLHTVGIESSLCHSPYALPVRAGAMVGWLSVDNAHSPQSLWEATLTGYLRLMNAYTQTGVGGVCRIFTYTAYLHQKNGRYGFFPYP